MSVKSYWPILGILTAIAITSIMDAAGLSTFSALPLAPLLAIFWYLQRLPRQEVGLAWGKRHHYLLAVLYPVSVAVAIALVSGMAGAIDLSRTNWKKTALNFALIAFSTIVIAIITEEGFFRGWLWGSLHKTGKKAATILVWTSIAFSCWHWSAVMLKTGFDPPRSQVPVFMVNAAVIGAVWGTLRWRSGSVIVSSVSHGIWNGMAYSLFGFGTKVGALGIRKTGLFAPEVGVLGLILNTFFLIGLLRWSRTQVPEPAVITAD